MPKRTRFFGSFEDAVQRLHRDLPLMKPVSIRRVHMKHYAGLCSLNKSKKRFTISIDKRLSEDAQVLVLLHEWAHALDWSPDKNRWPHSETWGENYARCLRIFDRVD